VQRLRRSGLWMISEADKETEALKALRYAWWAPSSEGGQNLLKLPPIKHKTDSLVSSRTEPAAQAGLAVG
jgi:hypothetical protein